MENALLHIAIFGPGVLQVTYSKGKSRQLMMANSSSPSVYPFIFSVFFFYLVSPLPSSSFQFPSGLETSIE